VKKLTWEGEYGYFELLTKREQLNDIIHKYAQRNGCAYNSAWSALDKAWEKETGKTLSLFRALMQRNDGKKITLPEYVIRAGLIDPVLVVAHGMIDNVIIRWLNEHGASVSCNRTPRENGLPDMPAHQDRLPLL